MAQTQTVHSKNLFLLHSHQFLLCMATVRSLLNLGTWVNHNDLTETEPWNDG